MVYIYLRTFAININYKINVGKYTSPTDGVGSRDPTAISTDKKISDKLWQYHHYRLKVFFQMFSKLHLYGESGGFGTVGHTFCRGLGWARDHHGVSVLFLLRHENPKDSVAHEKVRTLPSTLAWFVPTFVKIMCKWVIPPSIWLSTQHSPFLTRSGERNLARPFHSHAWVSCCWNLYARTNPLPSLKLMMQVDTGHRIKETNALQ